MFKNSYTGVIESWKVDLIIRRAKRWRLAGNDLDDVLQETVLSLLNFNYNQHRSNGASERTAVTAVVDRRLAMYHRSKSRHCRRTARFRDAVVTLNGWVRTSPIAPSKEIDLGLQLDVQSAMDEMSPRARQVCIALSEGYSINEIAKTLEISWRAVSREVGCIRQRLHRSGRDFRNHPTGTVEVSQ